MSDNWLVVVVKGPRRIHQLNADDCLRPLRDRDLSLRFLTTVHQHHISSSFQNPPPPPPPPLPSPLPPPPPPAFYTSQENPRVIFHRNVNSGTLAYNQDETGQFTLLLSSSRHPPMLPPFLSLSLVGVGGCAETENEWSNRFIDSVSMTNSTGVGPERIQLR